VNVEEQRRLLRWARLTIEAAVRGAKPPVAPKSELTPALLSPHGAFVTLKKQGALRGCIGMMDFDKPLWENVVRSAKAAALEDPRFPPVAGEELGDLRLEISALEPPRAIRSADEFDHLKHGIIITLGWNHGLFLPQVAREEGWDKTKTLEMVCWKAGLPADAWRSPDARLEIFTAEVFGEAERARFEGPI
jgi:AmmeMemoRadiSam system protein A